MVHERPYSHKKHSTDFLRQGAGVPSLHAAPFGVEVSFQWIFKINETLEMSPGQFSPHVRRSRSKIPVPLGVPPSAKALLFNTPLPSQTPGN